MTQPAPRDRLAVTAASADASTGITRAPPPSSVAVTVSAMPRPIQSSASDPLTLVNDATATVSTAS